MEKRYDADTSLAQLVEENPARARLFEERGLDFCCGGSQPLAEACDRRGLDLDALREELAELDRREDPEDRVEFESLTDLVDYIVDYHHGFLREELGPLGDLVDKVERVHGDNHPELHDLADVYEQLARELPAHLAEEEQILFPIVRQIDDGEVSEVERETARNLLDGLEHDHDETAAHLERIREITDDFDLPDDACPSYENMFARLEQLEADVHMHVHRENNVLFDTLQTDALAGNQTEA